MIWHPLLLTTLTAQAIGLLLLTAAAVKSFRILIGWDPAAADRSQLSLEIEAETAVILARWALGTFLFSSALMLLGITNVFHALIPGAMCGTGVLQAMGRAGTDFLVLDATLLGVLLFWNAARALGRRRPDYPLARLGARLLLLALPVAVLACARSVSAALGVDTHRPVDCCAVVYDQYRSLSEAQSVSGLSDGFWLTAWSALSLLLVGLAAGVRRAAASAAPKLAAMLAATAIVWVPVAAVTLTDILAAYHYGVLQHRCPWCLFLLQHRLAGLPLFGALAVVAFEGLTGYLLPLAVKNDPGMQPAALDRSRRAAGRILWALLAFLLLTVLPPLLWHLRFSVWIVG
ncbi:MAG: hypothetical protein WAK95_12570 [Desulfobacterales bacterium]